MARVTVEDCIEKIPNRFELVMTAAQRARKIGSGATLTVERDNDKNPVIALREIAHETINLGHLNEELIRVHQRVLPPDDEEDNIDLMDGEAEWNAIAAHRKAEENLYRTENIDAPEDEDEDDDDFEEEAGENPTLEDLAGN